MPSTDPVSSITNYHRLIVSYTDPVHSFIISWRTVEPTGSSLLWKWFSRTNCIKNCDFSNVVFKWLPEKQHLGHSGYIWKIFLQADANSLWLPGFSVMILKETTPSLESFSGTCSCSPSWFASFTSPFLALSTSIDVSSVLQELGTDLF